MSIEVDKQYYKYLPNFHTLVSLAVSLGLYFFYDLAFTKAFFLSSLVMNMYLRLLVLNFDALQVNTSSSRLMGIASGLRSALVAVAYAIFILKFNLNLWALAAGFIVYKVVLLGSGLVNSKMALK